MLDKSKKYQCQKISCLKHPVSQRDIDELKCLNSNCLALPV